MIICDLHIIRISRPPSKTDTPLVVNANAVLAFPVSFERFQSVSKRNTKIVDTDCRIQHDQFSSCYVLNFPRKFFWNTPIENPFCLFIAKRFDHSIIITYCVNNVKRYYRLATSIVYSLKIVPYIPRKDFMTSFISTIHIHKKSHLKNYQEWDFYNSKNVIE